MSKLKFIMLKTQNNLPKLVIVGVKANQDDIHNGHIAEFGIPCPNNCSSSNSLNI